MAVLSSVTHAQTIRVDAQQLLKACAVIRARLGLELQKLCLNIVCGGVHLRVVPQGIG